MNIVPTITTPRTWTTLWMWLLAPADQPERAPIEAAPAVASNGERESADAG